MWTLDGCAQYRFHPHESVHLVWPRQAKQQQILAIGNKGTILFACNSHSHNHAITTNGGQARSVSFEESHAKFFGKAPARMRYGLELFDVESVQREIVIPVS